MVFIFYVWYHEMLNFKCTCWLARVIEKTVTCTCIKKISTPLYRWGGTVALYLLFSWELVFEYLLHFINLNNAPQYIWLWTLQFLTLVIRWEELDIAFLVLKTYRSCSFIHKYNTESSIMISLTVTVIFYLLFVCKYLYFLFIYFNWCFKNTSIETIYILILYDCIWFCFGWFEYWEMMVHFDQFR